MSEIKKGGGGREKRERKGEQSLKKGGKVTIKGKRKRK